MRKLVSVLGMLGLAVTGLSITLPEAAGAAAGTTCSGTLAPGTYMKVVVPDGALCSSDGPITIRGGLQVGQGATFVLGSDENPVDSGTISGGVQSTNPAGVQIHHATVNGGINIQGGSGPFGGPFDVTWNAIEDNVIHGGVTIEGYDRFWFGFLGNTVSGSVNLNNNTLTDPDGNEFVTNTIQGSLNCSGNVPAPSAGDSGGIPNVVTGNKTGQCVSV
jgi:hypothetical protein